jgi:hypothetical protein
VAEAGRGAVSAAFLGVAPTSVYRCLLNGVQVAVKMSVTDFERDRLTQAPTAVLKVEIVRSLSRRNVLCLAATWPRHGVLAYE